MRVRGIHDRTRRNTGLNRVSTGFSQQTTVFIAELHTPALYSFDLATLRRSSCVTLLLSNYFILTT